jgi:hypothetical protein
LLYADKREVREMLSKCVVPPQRTLLDFPPFFHAAGK